jgi:hypothetical protein
MTSFQRKQYDYVKYLNPFFTNYEIILSYLIDVYCVRENLVIQM